MTFARDIRRWADRAKRGFHEVATEALINLSATIIIKTPVDTGLAANNWQPTTMSPATGTVIIGDRASQLTDVQNSVAVSIGSVYYLVNNLPYIRRLEYESWSDKAPRGMVRVSIEEFEIFIDNAIANL